MADKKVAARKGAGSRISPAYFLSRMGLFHRTGKNVIGIQLAGDTLRIIEIDRSTNPARIVNFSAIDPLMENVAEAADQIIGLMHEKGMTGRVVHATVYEQGTDLRQVSLPILAKNEMEAVVRRELKKIVPEASPKDIAFAFWHDKSAKKGRKADVLIGVIPQESSKRIISLMEQCNLDTELITSVPMSLIAAQKAMGEKFTSAVTASVHLERDRSYLVIANQANWVFSREFQSVLVKEEHKSDETQPLEARRRFVSARYLADQERLLIEVNRSLLYFKQRFRGEGVSKAVLSGEAFNLEEVAKAFQANLGIEGAIFSPVAAFDASLLGDRADKLARIYPSLALPLGAALQTVREAKLNFVPFSYINRYKERAHRLILTAASVVFIIALATGYLLIRNSRKELEAMLAENQEEKEIAELTKTLNNIAEVTTQRKLAETRGNFLDSYGGKKSSIDKLLVGLSYYIPDNVVLYMVDVDRSNQSAAQIAGQVRGLSVAESDETFRKFYIDLKQSGLFETVEEPAMSSRSEEGGYVLAFKIDGKLKG
ncbi:MAG: hypothetical protein V1794_06345 [Candidatus Glassbacteria bacterium]